MLIFGMQNNSIKKMEVSTDKITPVKSTQLGSGHRACALDLSLCGQYVIFGSGESTENGKIGLENKSFEVGIHIIPSNF